MRDHTNRGFTLLELVIVLTVLAILASIAVFILGRNPTRAANEAATIATMRTIVTAERVYYSTTGSGNYADFGELRGAELIDALVATGNKQGYSYVLAKQPAGFTLTATPVSNWTGTRSFFSDESGIIRARAGAGAGAADPPIGN